MKIEISDDYIDWVMKNTYEGEVIEGFPSKKGAVKALTEYINEILDNHKQSWEELNEK